MPKRYYRAPDKLTVAARYVAEGELRISRQKELIARLNKNGRPTDRAETVLRVPTPHAAPPSLAEFPHG
jgi:hypothetical protein